MKVLVTATNFSTLCADSYQYLLANDCEVIENVKGRPYTFEEQREVVGDIDGVIAGLDIWDEKIFKLAPKLKGIARFGVGVDNIDLQAASKHGVKVSNCKGINSNSVSEHALTLMLAIIRDIPKLDETTKNGEWRREVFMELNTMKIGMLGFGEISRFTVEKLLPFQPEILAYDISPDREWAKKLNVTIVDFEQLMSQSDLVSVHVPSLPATRHLINEKTLGMMKDGAYLINTSRGDIVDETALYKALKEGKLTAAGIDVFESEPTLKSNPLFQLDNIVVTPHAAGETSKVYTETGLATAKALVDVFNGKEPLNLLN